MDALIQSLEERKRGDAYAKVRYITERLGPMGEFGRSVLTRPPEPMERGKIYEYQQEPADLILAMQEVTDRRGQVEEAPPLKAFDEIVKREPYPVETKAREIIRRLRQPQRAGGHVYGGAGAVPEQPDSAGGLCQRLHRHLRRRRAGRTDIRGEAWIHGK